MDHKQNPSESWIEDLRHRFPTEDYVDRALTRKLRTRSGPAHTPMPVAAIAERLHGFLAKRLPGTFSLDDVRSLTGGSSKEQFHFRLKWRDEAGGEREESMVLRLSPAASIVETHRQREFEAMRALAGTVAVPQVFWVDPEGEEFGQSALISKFCTGVVKPPADGQITGPHQNLGPKYRALLTPQFIRDLAKISTFDWRSADLPSLGRPAEGTTEALLWGINSWERIWEEDSIEAYPLIAVGAKWLRDNAPPIDRISVVHGDYRTGNFLFDPEDGTITAQLDWELVHLGDRHEDLAHTFSKAFMERDENGELLVTGLCTQASFVSEYEKQTGLPVDLKRLTYYQIYDNWKFSIMCLATATRCALGMKTHQDILVGYIATAAPTLLRDLHRLLKEQM